MLSSRVAAASWAGRTVSIIQLPAPKPLGTRCPLATKFWPQRAVRTPGVRPPETGLHSKAYDAAKRGSHKVLLWTPQSLTRYSVLFIRGEVFVKLFGTKHIGLPFENANRNSRKLPPIRPAKLNQSNCPALLFKNLQTPS